MLLSSDLAVAKNDNIVIKTSGFQPSSVTGNSRTSLALPILHPAVAGRQGTSDADACCLHQLFQLAAVVGRHGVVAAANVLAPHKNLRDGAPASHVSQRRLHRVTIGCKRGQASKG